MRSAVLASLLAVTLLLVPAAPSFAGGHAGGGHGGHGFHGGHEFHGHFHGHAVIVGGPAFWSDPWWYYPPYYYYPPPQVVVEPAPVIVEEQSPQSSWYYCPSAKAYYPTAPTCPEVWIKVAPLAQ